MSMFHQYQSANRYVAALLDIAIFDFQTFLLHKTTDKYLRPGDYHHPDRMHTSAFAQIFVRSIHTALCTKKNSDYAATGDDDFDAITSEEKQEEEEDEDAEEEEEKKKLLEAAVLVKAAAEAKSKAAEDVEGTSLTSSVLHY